MLAGLSQIQYPSPVTLAYKYHLPLFPWCGVEPLERAQTTAELAVNVETRLSEELGQVWGLSPTDPGRDEQGAA